MIVIAANSVAEKRASSEGMTMAYNQSQPRASTGMWDAGTSASDKLQTGLAKAGAQSRGKWKQRRKGTHTHTAITGSRAPVTAHAGQHGVGTRRSRSS